MLYCSSKNLYKTVSPGTPANVIVNLLASWCLCIQGSNSYCKTNPTHKLADFLNCLSLPIGCSLKESLKFGHRQMHLSCWEDSLAL